MTSPQLNEIIRSLEAILLGSGTPSFESIAQLLATLRIARDGQTGHDAGLAFGRHSTALWYGLQAISRPAQAYHIMYKGSCTTFSPSTGFSSAGIIDNVPSMKQFSAMVREHMAWKHEPSCFVSVFSDETHATNWAMQWSRKHKGRRRRIYTIDLQDRSLVVFRAKTLVSRLDTHTDLAAKQYADEYLDYDEIQKDAVRNVRTISPETPAASTFTVDSRELTQQLDGLTVFCGFATTEFHRAQPAE
ncbi:hypothetical protein Slin15195_G077510 [Septoria linicola]|uniref:DUF7587 domain-containing protein n=1 Tax=Septoria linicola TaxID=215465 RepID=A0A9Q9AYY3_9PEZI|nr:hypothetical protein Slin15195_G077510 [Septoria linicola]